MFSETPSYQCKTCGSTEGCACRLLAVPPAETVVKETVRDFTELPVGSRVRHPKGMTEKCPLCDAPGVYILTPRWRYRAAREQWIHCATVSAVGYGEATSCSREVPKRRGKK